MHRPLRLTALALGLALLTACTGSSDDAAMSASGDSTAGGGVEGLTVPGAPAAPAPPGEPAGTTLARVDLIGSAVIRTAELGVRVDDVRAAADTAGRLVRETGGAVAFERADAPRDGDGDVASAELRLRVPPERFDDVLSRLAALGDERARTLSTEEVGDQIVDLDSRLATQRASVERVRALLAEAGNLTEVVQVEAELTRRTADLESLEARRAALGEQVALSTVVLRLDSEEGDVVAGAPGFLDGLRGGWEALVASALVLATVAGALLPFLPLVVLGVLVTARLRRRRATPAAATSG